MAYDLLTTSGINSLVNAFQVSEQNKLLTPLSTKKTRYQSLDTAYSALSGKLSSLNSILYDLTLSGSSSPLAAKKGASSNSSFADITAQSTATAGSNTIRVSQLAQSDLVLSEDPTSTSNSTITTAGTHNFVITAGDGTGGTYTSNVDVTFVAGDFTGGVISNQSVMTKIQSAINTNKAVVTSNSLSGSTLSSGSFALNLNGTVTTITYAAGTYSAVIDSIVTQINSVSGVSAAKIVNGANSQLQITVTDASKYLTIDSDTGTLVTELGIATTKLKGASGLVTASTFSPTSTTSQLSITSNLSGYDNRILSLTDSAGSSVLTSVGLNLGASRTTFVQNTGLDTAGYVNATTLLNAKITFNGLSLERNSNTITDLITGGTISLKSVMQTTDPTTSLTVSNDVTSVKAKIQDFITKFNDVYTTIKSQSASTSANRGLFIGDTNASSLLSILNSIPYSNVSGISTSQINSLSKLGITFDISTGMSLSNSTQLDDAISNNNDQVTALFNSTNGIASTLYNRVNPYLGSTGYIANSRTNFTDSINYINDSITARQSRIVKSAAVLRNNYLKLQSQLADLLTTQSMFSSNLFSASS
jgi:flagellar hook-associated protein 2